MTKFTKIEKLAICHVTIAYVIIGGGILINNIPMAIYGFFHGYVALQLYLANPRGKRK